MSGTRCTPLHPIGRTNQERHTHMYDNPSPWVYHIHPFLSIYTFILIYITYIYIYSTVYIYACMPFFFIADPSRLSPITVTFLPLKLRSVLASTCKSAAHAACESKRGKPLPSRFVSLPAACLRLPHVLRDLACRICGRAIVLRLEHVKCPSMLQEGTESDMFLNLGLTAPPKLVSRFIEPLIILV